MAKLGSYYGLCPLIDQKSLLGVSEDVITGCVIVTLGKNMAIKYKLSDQKQINSWSTKEKLSSPVIYDKASNKYVAVFNQHYIRVWDEDEKHLEKVKKIKFPIAIHTIIQCDNDSVVIFKNGQTLTLSYALEIRRDFPLYEVFDKSTVICDQTCLTVGEKYFIGLLIKSDNVFTYVWTLPETKIGDENHKQMIKIKLERIGVRVKLNGHVAMLTNCGPVLFTLWSDGRLYSYPLDKTSTTNEPCGSFYSVIESLSRQQPVCLLPLSSNYIAMYGADTNQEGASLQLYNIQFHVTQAKQQFKLFTDCLKLWRIANNILLTVAQNLAVIPFHLATEQLAALVASHKLVTSNEDDDVAIVTEMTDENWMNEETPKCVESKKLIPDLRIVFELIKEGWSETAICEEIFPKLIENEETETIQKSLHYFTDIPETVLVKLLIYCLDPKHKKRTTTDLLDQVLSIPYNDILLLPQLRIHLKFDHVLILLQYLSHTLNESTYILPDLDVTQTEAKIINWTCLVLDSHYQQLLLSKDVKIIQCLEYFKALLDTYTLCLEEFKKVEPIVGQLKRRQNTKTKLVNTKPVKYSIEKLKLY